MAMVSTAVAVVWSLFFTPFLLFILCIIFLASIGKSLGVRRLYVNILLKLFEYGRQHIEVAKKLKRVESSEDEGGGWEGNEQQADGGVVIHRENLLAPDRGLERPSKPSNTSHATCNGTGPKGAGAAVGDAAATVTTAAAGDGTDSEQTVTPIEESTPTTPSSLDFDLSSCLDYVKAGVESIIEDQVTSVFEAEELRSWNLLTRTNRQYEFISWRLTVIWMMGFFVRYCFLLPLRILICFIGVVWMVVALAIIGQLPDGYYKRRISEAAYKISFRILCRSLSCMLTFHMEEYKPLKGGYCVANHTSPIDVIMLSSENCFSLIGQRHGGFLGLLQRALARASPHIWFERSEVKDRSAVTNRLREHVSNPDNPPILIFPEGTCINNTSVMQFKKGSFEVGGVIYPVAIKYDPKFGDAFWNSSRFSMMQYLYMMMTSWAIVCDVWYLPPMQRRSTESAIEFANRVKAVIARQGGLVDLVWDGQLKRMKAKKEWKELQQEEFSRRLKGE